jgi:hypothetical protein
MAELGHRRKFIPGGLVSLGWGDESSVGDAIGMLLACHQRIRSFSALAVHLAGAEDAPAESRAEMAESIHCYFTIALPLHVADEEVSLRPRMLETPARDEVAAQLVLMAEQHYEVERLLAVLTPSWSTLAPERIDLLHRMATPCATSSA